MTADDITTAVSPAGPAALPVAVSCAVLHLDADGNTVPCPGYPLCNYLHVPQKDSEPIPQPDCAQCHTFGPAAVQDAVQRLRKDMADMVKLFSNHQGTAAVYRDVSTVLDALDKHHREGWASR